MPLTDRAIRATKPSPKARKMADERGLYLLLQPNGARYWRLKYRFGGKERLLALGVYPEITLARARLKRDDARQLLDQGVDPMAARRADKRAERAEERDTFAAVAQEWLAKESPGWVAAHATRVESRLDRDVLPFLGSKLAAEITAPEILDVVRRVADRGAVDTARRALWSIGQILRFAVATGRAANDPTGSLRGALPAVRSEHRSAITDPKELGELLSAIKVYKGSHVVRCALQLLPHVFVRPGELRHAEWSEIDFDSATWAIPSGKMKARADHLVPLSRQAVNILKEVEPLTSRSQWVFPGGRSFRRPMSDNTVTAALRRMGYTREQMTGHGFRATARTLLDEQLEVPAHLIEHQLAHVVRDPLARAYNRTTHLRERKKMMQRWSDYLDSLRDGAKVIPLHRSAG